MYKTISMDSETDQKPNYTYLIKNTVSTNLLMDDIIRANKIGYINILCYHVTNKFSKYPFIQIMLEKTIYIDGITQESFVFPFVGLSRDINEINGSLSTIVLNKVKSGLLDIGCDPSSLDEDAFVGLINNNTLCLVDISSVDIFRISNTKLNKTWFALPTEIMNTQTICNIHIANSVSDVFLLMPELGMLHNPQTNNSVYPLPDAVYTGSYFKNVEFSSVFGVPREQLYISCGEYFYFYRIFEDAVKEGGWTRAYLPTEDNKKSLVDNEYGRYIRGGINRYALFAGNYVTHIEKTNKFSLTDDIINDIFGEKDTIVIQYENEGVDTILPDLLVKNYESYTPISYHMLNKSILGEKYDIDNQDKYSVL